MVKLPNADLAIIDERKLTAYLLDRAHRLGGPKAAFLEGFGFSAGNWERLRDAILAHALSHEIEETRATRHGQLYEVVGPLDTPEGRGPTVRVVWMVRHDEQPPRLGTLVPS